MRENVESIVLEQLRLIREDLGALTREMQDLRGGVKEDVADLKTELMGQRAILVGLGSYISAIDTRVEHIEARIGG